MTSPTATEFQDQFIELLARRTTEAFQVQLCEHGYGLVLGPRGAVASYRVLILCEVPIVEIVWAAEPDRVEHLLYDYAASAIGRAIGAKPQRSAWHPSQGPRPPKDAA